MVDSHPALRILTFGVVVEGLLPATSPPPRRKLLLSRDAESVHHSPNALCLALLPRVPAHCIASIDALSDCIPNTQTPTKRTADALGRQKSAELRANQEAGFGAEHRDTNVGESVRFVEFWECFGT